VVVGSVAVGTNPFGIYVAGRYAYTANHGASTISVIDVSNPASPVVVGSVAVGTYPFGIYVAGRYAYTANYDCVDHLSGRRL
jgi:YVTN family beta-propeller protein